MTAWFVPPIVIPAAIVIAAAIVVVLRLVA